MSGDIRGLLQLEYQRVLEARRRLEQQNVNLQSKESLKSSSPSDKYIKDDGEVSVNGSVLEENIENISPNKQTSIEVELTKEKPPLVEQLDLSSIENSFKRDKQLFIDKLIHSENPFTFRSDVSSQRAMLRYGDYSPNKPELRVTAAPYLGLGEYEQRKHILKEQRRDDYRQYIEKSKHNVLNNSKKSYNEIKYYNNKQTKAVQTDIKNIKIKLVQHEIHFNGPSEKDVSPQIIKLGKENQGMHRNHSVFNSRLDQRYNSHNSYINSDMDKPKSILTNRKSDSSRDHLISDLRHGYSTTFLDGFSYKDEEEEIERERLKRELYQAELRNQIEEKRHLAALREEQDRREQELENRRLEQQLLRMHDEQIRDEQRRNRRDEQYRRYNEDYLTHKGNYRLPMDSETCLRNTKVASKQSHYSPPVSRRNPYSYNIPSSSVFAEPTSRYNPNRYDLLTRKDVLNRMDSINTPRDTNSRLNSFSRYDSLSRIDSLNRQEALSRLESLSIKDNLNRVQRRHSATQQDLSMLRKSPKSQRRSSSTSRYELDTLPIPILKVHSPVAKELKNSIAVSSSKHSDALNRLEDKWQVPAVQRNIINHNDLLGDRQGRSILTQLGAIRMQLQQEQIRMDEELRRRGFPTI